MVRFIGLWLFTKFYMFKVIKYIITETVKSISTLFLFLNHSSSSTLKKHYIYAPTEINYNRNYTAANLFK